MDLAKYRQMFLEEAGEHLADMGRALLVLEKRPDDAEAIGELFRLAHSIKGMAGSLEYGPIAELAHRLEDRMEAARTRGRVEEPGALALLFRGLEGLERMVAAVQAGGEPAEDAPLLEALAGGAPAAGSSSGSAPSASAAPRAEAGSAHAVDPAAPSAGPGRVTAPPPPPSVRVATRTLDRFLASVGEVILSSSQLRTAAEGEDGGRRSEVVEGFDRMERVVAELQRRALDLRTTPLLRAVEPLPRLARELAARAGKKVRVELVGAELELDRSILDRLGEPLVHLVRNAVDHGLEPPERRRAAGKAEEGELRIEARREKDTIRIAVRDDGAGIDLAAVRARAVAAGLVHPDLAEDLPPREVAALVFQPGLSTAAAVSEVSGRGVGMDAVRATIEALGGSVELTSRRGRGTVTTLVVPITAAVQRVLLAGLGAEIVAFPIARVERLVEVPAEAIERSGREAFALIDGEPVPVLDLAGYLRIRPGVRGDTVPLVLADLRGARTALRVERLAGQQEIYVKPVPELLAGVRGLAGLTLLGDGRPVFVLDLNQLL